VARAVRAGGSRSSPPTCRWKVLDKVPQGRNLQSQFEVPAADCPDPDAGEIFPSRPARTVAAQRPISAPMGAAQQLNCCTNFFLSRANSNIIFCRNVPDLFRLETRCWTFFRAGLPRMLEPIWATLNAGLGPKKPWSRPNIPEPSSPIPTAVALYQLNPAPRRCVPAAGRCVAHGPEGRSGCPPEHHS